MNSKFTAYAKACLGLAAFVLATAVIKTRQLDRFPAIELQSISPWIERTRSSLLAMCRNNWMGLLLIALFLAPATTPAQAPTNAAIAPIAIFRTNTCVLFQGDSITDGNRGRSLDPNHILGHGYAFIIAAKYGAAFPELNLTFLNRGVSGNTVADLARRWRQDTLDLKPDILSILIGVNDTSRGVPFDQFEQDYDKLLADTLADNPNLRLVLCTPFTLPSGKKKEHYEDWAASIRQREEIVAKLARKYHAALVRFQPVFDAASQKAPAEHWIWDGIHPTYSGHQLMADEWVRGVREFWPGQ
jgi:lysophospholipase L1-like esterase